MKLNFTFSYLCRDIAGYKGKLLATLIPTIIIAVFIAGVLLSAIYGAPLVPTMATITAEEFVSCVGIGLPLLIALERAL